MEQNTGKQSECFPINAHYSIILYRKSNDYQISLASYIQMIIILSYQYLTKWMVTIICRDQIKIKYLLFLKDDLVPRKINIRILTHQILDFSGCIKQQLNSNHYLINAIFLESVYKHDDIVINVIINVFLIDRDWEDMKHMPEYSTLMKDFSRQRSS